MIKIIAFDLDNTLYNHEQYVKSSYNDIAEFVTNKYSLNKENYYKWIFERWKEMGSSYNKIFKESYKYFNLNSFEKDINKILNIYHSNKNADLKLYDGIDNLLYKFNEEYKLVLITDGHVNTQRFKIDKLKIKKYFKSIYISGEFGEKFYKPSTKMFVKCMNDYNIRSQNMVYIGDNPNLDYPPCKKLNIEFIRLKAGEYSDIDINDFVKEIDLKNLNNIFKLVGDINEKNSFNNNN
jgi:putative hydrolase of the HAD superfamily